MKHRITRKSICATHTILADNIYKELSYGPPLTYPPNLPFSWIYLKLMISLAFACFLNHTGKSKNSVNKYIYHKICKTPCTPFKLWKQLYNFHSILKYVSFQCSLVYFGQFFEPFGGKVKITKLKKLCLVLF